MEKPIALSDAEVAAVAGGNKITIVTFLNTAPIINSFDTNSFNTNSFNTLWSSNIMPGNSAFGRMHNSKQLTLLPL